MKEELTLQTLVKKYGEIARAIYIDLDFTLEGTKEILENGDYHIFEDVNNDYDLGLAVFDYYYKDETSDYITHFIDYEQLGYEFDMGIDGHYSDIIGGYIQIY